MILYVRESRSDSRPVFGIFRNMETLSVHLFQGWKSLCTLRHTGKISYQDKVVNIRI